MSSLLIKEDKQDVHVILHNVQHFANLHEKWSHKQINGQKLASLHLNKQKLKFISVQFRVLEHCVTCHRHEMDVYLSVCS